MNKKFGIYILLGLVIGAMFAFLSDQLSAIAFWGITVGALSGVFVG